MKDLKAYADIVNARLEQIPAVIPEGTYETGGMPWLLVLLSAAFCAGAWLLLRRRELGRLMQYALGLILGGALGNLLDRVFLGYVIDFIDPVFFHWFVCNPADLAITCGAAMAAGWLLFGKEESHV